MKRLYLLRNALCLLLLGVLLAQAGCGSSDDQAHEKSLFAMDTVMSLKAYGSKAEAGLTAAATEIQRLDSLLSISNEAGDICAVNRTGSAAVSQETISLIADAQALYDKTGGAFDCTILPLMELWGFPTEDYHVPTQAELDAVLPLVDSDAVTISGDTVSLPAGAGLDLGGIAKGYASERVCAVLSQQGVSAAVVSLGGNVATLGKKPDGSPWTVAIQDPTGAESYAAALSLTGQPGQMRFAVTSGSYQRYFQSNGVTYHHILNPSTGYPADTGLASVTIVCGSGAWADGLSTALFVMGLDAAADFWRSGTAPTPFEAVFLTTDGKLHVTEGLTDALETDWPTTVLEKTP